MSLSQWISNSGDFAPEVFGKAWRNSQLSGRQCGAAGFSWVEARDAVKHPAKHRTNPHNEELSSPKVHSAEGETAVFNHSQCHFF